MNECVFYIGEFIFDLVKVLMAFRLVEAASTPRRSKPVETCVVWVTGVVVAGITVYNIFLCRDVFSNYMMIICAIFLSVVVLFLRRIKWLEAFSIIYLFWVMIHILDFFIQTLTYKVLNACRLPKYLLLEADIERGLYLMCFSICVAYIGRWLLSEKEMFKRIKHKLMLELILVPVMTLIMGYFQRIYIDLMTEDYMANWTLFWLACIVAFGGGVLYTQKIRALEVNKVMQMRMQLLEANYEQATRRYKEKAELLHDEKHHVDAIREMLDSGKVEDAIRYVSSVSHKISQSGNRIWSNHLFLDVVLNMKVQEAKDKLIDVEIRFDDMKDLAMQETDISVLFGNLLDNAIEAVEKIIDPDHRWIKIFGERKGKLLVLNMSNPVGQDLRFDGKQLITSKSDRELHGFGMQSIQRIVERHHGEMDVTQQEEKFLLTLILNGFCE